MHNGFTSPYCKNYLIKQSFSSDIKIFLIELRLKIPCERRIKIISPRRASLPYWASSPPDEQLLSFRKTLMSQFRENLWTDEKMDGRPDERADIADGHWQRIA